MDRKYWHPNAPIAKKEARAVAGPETPEQIMQWAKKERAKQKEREAMDTKEDYYRERREREWNFESMVL